MPKTWPSRAREALYRYRIRLKRKKMGSLEDACALQTGGAPGSYLIV